MPLEGGKVCLDLGFGLDTMRPSAFLASGDGDRCLPDKHRPSSTRVHQPTSLHTSLSRSGEWSDSGDRERRTGSSSRTPNLEKTLRLLGGLGSSSKSRGSGLFLSLPLLGEPSVKDTWRFDCRRGWHRLGHPHQLLFQLLNSSGQIFRSHRRRRP